jgi:cytochrome P450
MDEIVARLGVFLALQEAEHVDDPYPLYHKLRRESPFHWDFVLCGWILTRYVDVRAALVDPRLTTRTFPWDVNQLPPDLQDDLAPLGRVVDVEVLYRDSADHDRLRQPLNRAFNPAAFERLRPGMEDLADSLLATAEQRGSMDMVRDYAEPLTEYMVGELLGLQPEDRTEFIKWCDRVREFVTARRMGPETVKSGREAARRFEQIRTYVRTLIATRRFADDMVGNSFAVDENELPPTEEEFLANCVFFLHTGIRNTFATLNNGIVALLRHPEQFAMLRNEPQLLMTAVDELLRYDSPVQFSIRGASREMEFQGQGIGPKHVLVSLLGAANRDPEQFAEADRLDLTRQPNRHLALGLGAHGCVGGWMARFGVAIGLDALIRRRTGLRLAPGRRLQWQPAVMRRTVRALPVWIDSPPRKSRRFQLRMAPALSSIPTRVVRVPIPSSQ